MSSEAVQKAKGIFGSSLFSASGIEEFKSGVKFDCIIAIETIEHLLDPGAFLDRLIELLIPGGVIILTTPNKSFFPSSVTWESSLPPVHLWWFTEKSLYKAGEKRGLSVEFVDFNDFFSPARTLFWDTQNIRPIYQGSLSPRAFAEGRTRLRSKLWNWLKKLVSSTPFSLFAISKVFKLLEPGRLLVAGRQCHCMGVVIRKPVSNGLA